MLGCLQRCITAASIMGNEGCRHVTREKHLLWRLLFTDQHIRCLQQLHEQKLETAGPIILGLTRVFKDWNSQSRLYRSGKRTPQECENAAGAVVACLPAISPPPAQPVGLVTLTCLQSSNNGACTRSRAAPQLGRCRLLLTNKQVKLTGAL